MNGAHAACTERLDAVNAARNAAALGLTHAGRKARGRGRSICTAFSAPAMREGTAGAAWHGPAVLTDAQEAALASGLQHEVERVLGIVAIMIAEAEADIAQINDLMELVASLDDAFFDFAGKDIEEMKKNLPPKAARALERIIVWYRRRLI